MLGRLITPSHVSLRDRFNVSSVAIDAIVDAALASQACLGARMTGAGFAGYAIALCAKTMLTCSSPKQSLGIARCPTDSRRFSPVDQPMGRRWYRPGSVSASRRKRT
jgi:mevalonate kinase